jgi:hypothetical protein
VTDQQFVNCLRRIEFEYGRAGWHGQEGPAPALYAVHLMPTQRMAAIRLGIPDVYWDAGPPGPVMEGIAAKMAEYPTLLGPFRVPGWCGVALAAEAWSTHVTTMDEVHRLSVDRSVYLQPDARTVRLVYGVTRELVPGYVSRYQDEPVVVDGSDQAMTGSLLHGLSTLVGTIDELLDHT